MAAPGTSPAAVEVVRGDVVESRHAVVVAVADSDGTRIHGWGDTDVVTYLRSAAKPFQAMPLITSGAADALDVPASELALAAGSHNGQPVHVEAARRLLARSGLDAAALQCGRHPPFHKPTAAELGDGHTPLHHNCSGKHAGMLAACVHNGWSTDDYLDKEHPVQQEILGHVAWATGLQRRDVLVGVDGCGVPTFAVPVHAAARSFALLAAASADGDAETAALARVRQAMCHHPEMVAGDDRLDTKVMRASDGRIVVKAGAEACYGAGLREAGHGIAVKVLDGASRAVAPVLGAVFDRLEALSPEAAARLDDDFRPTIESHAGRAVGRIRARLP